MPPGGEHLGHQQRVGGLVGHEDVVDAALEAVAAADLDGAGLKHAGWGAAVGGRPAQGDLAVAGERDLGPRRQVRGGGRATERIGPAAQLPVAALGRHAADPVDDHDAQLLALGGSSRGSAGIEGEHLEADMAPCRRLRRVADDRPVRCGVARADEQIRLGDSS
jgi:hypothetical protein